jgi:tight adherence protein C
MDQDQLFLLSLVGVVGAIGYGITWFFLTRKNSKLCECLSSDSDSPSAIKAPPAHSFVHKLGQAASKPFAPRTREKQSALKRKLGYAGITSRTAVGALVGFRMMLLIGLGALGYLIGLLYEADLAGLVVGAMIGYQLPMLWLRLGIGRNHKALAKGLPDALDLMVVCVEAGLTMEAAMQRVGQEVILAHPNLARELGITHMETQMGVPRSEALRNLALRSGSKEIKSLTAMLIQAERLGTSIGKALRVHAESMRLKRQYAAQEMAAKASVKLIFPVAMLIFPAVIVVLIGPAIIQMIESGFFQKQ